MKTEPTADGPLPLALIGLTVVAGLVDAVSFLGLDRVFVANMTGNVVFLGFFAGGATGFSAVLSLVAIACFMLGARAGGMLGRSADGHRGRFLGASSAIQSAAVGGALLVSLAPSAVPGGYSTYALVVLLALAMGLQNATARRLGVADITTTVLTLTLTGLAADSRHPNTGRRLAAVAAMFLGAAIGAVLLLRIGMSAALAFTLAILLANAIAGHRWSSSAAAWTAAK